MLFQSFLQQPTGEEVRWSYLNDQHESAKAVQQLGPLNSLGYSKEQIVKIKSELAKAGL